MTKKGKKVREVSVATIVNTFGIQVKMCCASCVHKDLTRAVSLRRCLLTGEDVEPTCVCECWAMSEQLQMAGRNLGQVKRKAYLRFLVAEREDESLQMQLGLLAAPKSIAQIRAEFEREHGSVYMED